MSFREALLARDGALEADEAAALAEWLEALREDVDLFGATPEDEARMAAIEARLAAAAPAQGAR